MPKWILAVLGVLVGLVLFVVLVGALLPQNHKASASIALGQPADSVWNVIRDRGGSADWWDEIEAVERADVGDRETWNQRDRRGQTMPIEVVESQPPRRLVTRIADEDLPFGGTWTFEISESAGGSTLTLTEDGVVHNAFFRFMARFVFGHYATIESFLRAAGQRFGEDATVLRVEGARSRHSAILTDSLSLPAPSPPPAQVRETPVGATFSRNVPGSVTVS